MAKYVKQRKAPNYITEGHRYDFTGLTFSTPLTKIKIIEKIILAFLKKNVYGLRQENKNNKNYNIVFSLKNGRRGESGPFRFTINYQ